ncbi:MAG: hypothetical protein VB031_03330 [Eubacteriaceae bacterium]|nr:hypothetical protein [Eubacteriaceae bacterium]
MTTINIIIIAAIIAALIIELIIKIWAAKQLEAIDALGDVSLIKNQNKQKHLVRPGSEDQN